MSNSGSPGPRELMPNVARLVDEKRAQYGAAHVRECITRGMRGEPGWFYAFEAGMVQGTPFTACSVTTELLATAVMLGGRFACVMRPPELATTTGVRHGAH